MNLLAMLKRLWANILIMLAYALEIPGQAPGMLWVFRVVFRAPRPGHADFILLFFTSLGQTFVTRLGIGKSRKLSFWLWRLFFRPRRWHRLSTDLRRQRLLKRKRPSLLPRWIKLLLTPLWHLVSFVGARLEFYLPKIDWERAGKRFEFFSSTIDRIPYLRYVVLLAAFSIGVLICTTPLTLKEQARLFILVWITALFMRRIPGRLVTLSITMLSMIMTGRYMWWRMSDTLVLNYPWDAAAGYVLFAAEFYTWVILLFGYVQTAWPLNRKPSPLPADPADWPTVDVFIPTYNEPMSVIQPTVYAAKGMDWPHDKIRVYLLDDGSREEFRQFAEQAGIGYIVRERHDHAKAGNINHALTLTQGEYIAIFDCDHIPTRSFLQLTMGEFIKDSNCAMVQTPHHFFSPDPFERNFDNFRRVPNEGSLFYGLIQDGNDFWNAAFFCGSCAVIKRGPLEQVGGIAVETVTEDAHTALKLHRLGYNSSYIRVVQAAGLATESLSGHIGQRIRWARGMAQIFRLDNPWLGKGLSLFQRMCYSTAMLHFFYGIPRLIFLMMPCAYLYFGLHVINTPASVILAYVLPYLIIANLANSRIQRQYRHSFWAEIYESVLAWYIVLPTTIAFLNPKLGKFNVTAKGGKIEDEYLDWNISSPYIVLLLVNLVGLLCGVARLLQLLPSDDPPSTVLMNMFWAIINATLLGAAIGVAKEARQVRISHRIPLRVPATLILPNGHTLACYTEDYSVGGLGIKLPDKLQLQSGEKLGVCLSRGVIEHYFPASVTRSSGHRLGIKLDNLTPELTAQLIQCTFGRADAWIEWDKEIEPDTPLQGLFEVLEMGFQGYLRLIDSCVDALTAVFTRRDRTHHH